MKLLQVTPYLAPAYAAGGPSFTSLAVAQGLSSLGHHIETIASNRDADGYLIVRPDVRTNFGGVNVTYCHTRRGRLLYSPSLKGTLTEHIGKAGCVLCSACTWNYFGLVSCSCARKCDKPYLLYPHGVFDPWALAYRWIRKKAWWLLVEKRNYAKAAAIVALTRAEVDQVRRMGVRTRIEQIPNGVNPAEYSSGLSRAQLEERFPSLRGRRWVLFLGRLHPKKGLDLLIPALASVRVESPDVSLVIAGPDEGGYQAQVVHMVQDNNLQETSLFTGPVSGSTKVGLLREADVFVLPSRSEGLPMAVLEAMACGTPVLITYPCHLPEVAEAAAGLVVEVSQEAIAGALTALLRDETGRKQMGANGMRLVRERFTWQRVAEQTAALCQDVLAKA